MIDFQTFLLTERKNRKEDIEYVKKNKLGNNITLTIDQVRQNIRKILSQSEVLVPDFEKKTIPELMEILKQNGLEYRQRSRKTSDISQKDNDFAYQNNIKNPAALRSKLLRSIKLPYDVASKMSLQDLLAKADEVKPTKVSQKRNWMKFEKDVANGINILFKSGFFVISKNGKQQPITDNERFQAVQAGGSKKSDVQVIHQLESGKSRDFYVECKMNYATANYFKFQMQIVNGEFRYDPKFFEAGCDESELKEVEALFKRIDLGKFLKKLATESDLKSSWEHFQDNIKDTIFYLKRNDQWKDYVKGVPQPRVFPRDFKHLAKAFDLYVDDYITRYQNILNRLCDVVEPKEAADELRKRIRKNIDIADDEEEIRSAFVDELYKIEAGNDYHDDTWYVTMPDGEDIEFDITMDEEEFNRLIEMASYIESCLNTLLQYLGRPAYDFSTFSKITDAEKLKYFYMFFIGTMKNDRVNQDKYKMTFTEGQNVMSIIRINDYLSEDLSQMISDYYLHHGKCHYIQVQDCIYQLDDSKNAFGLDKLPMFKDQVQKFNIDLHVSDSLDRINLKIFAIDPETEKSIGKKYSFKEADQNFIGKKLGNVVIEF